MTGESKVLLKQTVFRLLEYNRRGREIFDEIVSLNLIDGDRAKESKQKIAEIGNVPVVTSFHNDVPYSVEDCLRTLVCLCKSTLGQTFTQEQRDEADALMSILKAHNQRGHLTFSNFVETLSTECQGHLEIWMLLHKHGIFGLQDYIERNWRNSDFVVSLTEQILERDKYTEAKHLISEVLSELVNLGYSASSTRDMSKEYSNTSIAVLDNLVKDCLCKFLKSENKTGTVTESLCCISVPLNIQKSFYSHMLAVILGYKPEMKVSIAVRDQFKWMYPKINNGLVTLYKQVLMVLNVTEILAVIRQILEQNEVNWQLFLSFFAVLIVCIQESQKHILEFTDNLLQEGLEDSDLETTITGLLVARQVCLQGPHVFMSYADWFQRTFSDSSRSFAKSRKSFTFLMKLLTDLAPYESPQHLKVHILRPPYVPGKCRQILTDYVMLAKTRLQDLQESIDVSSADSMENNKILDSFSEEVLNAVESFNTLGKIPTSIIEASIFRKPYYIGQFLPVLLKPRPLPDIPDARMKLITALKKADKIPQSMFENYEKQCRKEAMQLMEGVFEDLDSDDDMELPSIDQLDNSLQHLHSVVNTDGTSADKLKHTVSEVVSVIASKVEACLSDNPVNQMDSSPIDMTQNSTLADNSMQVVDLILNRVCDVMQSVYESGNFNFTWLTKLIEALIQYRKFTQTLYKRIAFLLLKQACGLHAYHIDSLASMLVEIHMLKIQTPTILPCGCADRYGSILEFIIHHLSIRNQGQVEVTVRFLVSCMKYVYSSHLDENTLNDVPYLMKKFTYLSQRFVPEFRNVYTDTEQTDRCTDIRDVVILLNQAKFVNKLSEKYVVRFQDWLDCELQVDVESDILTCFQRYKYYQFIIYHHFRRSPQGFDTYGEGALIMFKCLLDLHKRENKDQIHACLYKLNKVGKGAETEIINLLSNLIQLFTESEVHHESSPWLPQQLKDYLKDVDSEITAQSIVLNFTRLAMSLPAYLLFSNVPRNLTSITSQLKGTLDFINEIYVEHALEEVFLPVSFTVYIAQGLLQATSQDHYGRVVEFITENCPAISLAFVVHVRAVTPFLDQFIQGRSEFAKFYENLRSKNFNTLEKSWLSACLMFSQIVSSNNREENIVDSEEIACDNADIETVLPQIKTVDSSVKYQVTEMLFHQLTYLTQFAAIRNYGQVPGLHSALKFIVQQNDSKDILSALLCSKLDPTTQKCVKRNVIKLYPVTVLRFLRDVQINVGQQLIGDSLNGLLTAYVELCQLYEEENSTTKVVETAEITQTCTFMVTVIEKTPRKILKFTNQDVLMDCGPLICDAVLQHI